MRRVDVCMWAALISTCTSACGGDDGATVSAGGFDGGMLALDASVAMDASESGDGASDAANDASTVVNGGSCTVRGDGTSVVAQRFFSPQSPISVAAHAQGALLSWSQFQGGKSRVFSRWFGVTADAVDAPSIADDSTQVEVSSAHTGTGFVSTWSDDVSGHLELRARRTDDTGATLDSTPVALTSDGSDHHDAMSAAGADGNVVVAFTDADAQHGGTLLLGADAKPLATPHDVPDFAASVGRPALAAFGAGYLLVWVDASARHVHLQKLDASGAPVGASVQVDSEGSAQGNLAIATTAAGGAVTFDVLVAGVRAEVRLRTLDANGMPSGIEQKVTPYPDTGLHPAVAATRGGYIVAYRSVSGADAALKVVLLDGQGKAIPFGNGSLAVASLQQQDLPLAMDMASDGQNIFVGWLDQTPNTTEYQLQRAWIECD